MSSALSSGVAGLKAHTQLLDVIGNNIANLNTPGFKQSRVIFSDLFYQTLRPATGSIAGSIGGTNPVQIGSGSILAQVDVDQSQGSLETTGGETDFALSGNGFFVLSDGKQDFFTRVGAFDVDESGVLVDRATGNRVQRTGTVGELFGNNPGFQTSGNKDILVPIGASIAGEQTTELELKGVLSSAEDEPVVEVLTSLVPYLAGGSAAVGTTKLNQLDINTTPYAVGDAIDITGVDVDGTIVSTTFAVDDTTTLDQLFAAIDSAFSGSTPSLDSAGNLVLTADESGDVPLALQLADNSSNTGRATFSDTDPIVSTIGADGGTVTTTFEIFDPQGGSHAISLSFERGAGNVWELTATINAADGVMVDGSVENLRFDENGGDLLSAGSVGTGDTNLIVQLAGFSTPQTIALDFGIGATDGLKSVQNLSSVLATQNGFGSGTLTSISVDVNGVIEGAASNGRRVPIAQLAIASFSNPKGLTNVGNNYLVESLNSGPVQIGTALSSGRGSVVGGQIESSNVDIALQFTKMIIAQRGFSANARTITITDEILEELTNLIR